MLAPAAWDRFADSLDFVTGELIADDLIAWLERGAERLFDLG